MTPFLTCIQAGNTPIAAKLLDLGANISAIDISRNNCLHHAIHHTDPALLQHLLKVTNKDNYSLSDIKIKLK